MSKVTLLYQPTEADWLEVKRRALVTVGMRPKTPPTDKWKHDILEARHSPIRYLRFSFLLEVPYWVSVHLCRHVHAQPFVGTQRNDRQTQFDRTKAPQDTMVQMIWDITGEEMLIIANKRLCKQASAETREVVQMMCDLLDDIYQPFLVPMCQYHGGVCHEMYPCHG